MCQFIILLMFVAQGLSHAIGMVCSCAAWVFARTAQVVEEVAGFQYSGFLTLDLRRVSLGCALPR